MQAKPSPSPTTPRSADRRPGLCQAPVAKSPALPFSKSPPLPVSTPRPLPRRRQLNTARLHAGIVWVAGRLIHRYHLSVAWVAREARIGPQSLRDYLRGDHPNGWHTESQVALVLGRFPDELERLTRRRMRKFRRREQRRHAAEPRWTLHYPWELAVLLEFLELIFC